MKLFDNIIDEVRNYISGLSPQREITERDFSAERLWPEAEKGNIVLQSNMGAELGNPREESTSFVLWTNSVRKVHDGRITLIGPDIGNPDRTSLPFGKVVILSVNDFTEENCYEYHREIELMRYDLNLRGYMMRAVSQQMREWSRISKEALETGCDLFMLGNSLIRHYTSKEYITGAEILFVTSSKDDVRALKKTGGTAQRLISAMNKMAEEMSFDCDTCEYIDVCSEVLDLRNLRNTLKKEEKRDAQ